MNTELIARCLARIQEQDVEIARLRVALELIGVPMRPDGTYNRDRTACGIIAREALGTKPATELTHD